MSPTSERPLARPVVLLDGRRRRAPRRGRSASRAAVHDQLEAEGADARLRCADRHRGRCPQAGEPQRELVLPGNVEAFTDAPIYARTNGYLKTWYVDIGTRRQEGPAARRHRVAGSRPAAPAGACPGGHGGRQRAARAADGRPRDPKLVDTNAVSRQEYDNAVSALAARQAETASASANVRRLRTARRASSASRRRSTARSPLATPTSASSSTPAAPAAAASSSASPRPASSASSSPSLRPIRAAARPGVPVDLTVVGAARQDLPRRRRPHGERDRSRDADAARRGRHRQCRTASSCRARTPRFT